MTTEALSAHSQRSRLIRRRWWDGQAYSVEVDMGSTDEEAAAARYIVGIKAPALVQYRGLTQAPAEGYTYSLDAKSRTQLAREVMTRTRVPLED